MDNYQFVFIKYKNYIFLNILLNAFYTILLSFINLVRRFEEIKYWIMNLLTGLETKNYNISIKLVLKMFYYNDYAKKKT